LYVGLYHAPSYLLHRSSLRSFSTSSLRCTAERTASSLCKPRHFSPCCHPLESSNRCDIQHARRGHLGYDHKSPSSMNGHSSLSVCRSTRIEVSFIAEFDTTSHSISRMESKLSFAAKIALCLCYTYAVVFTKDLAWFVCIAQPFYLYHTSFSDRSLLIRSNGGLFYNVYPIVTIFILLQNVELMLIYQTSISTISLSDKRFEASSSDVEVCLLLWWANFYSVCMATVPINVAQGAYGTSLSPGPQKA
jgi:hypothetical protein